MSVRESGLPRHSYSESIFLSDWLRDQLGIISGHQGFGKKFFAAEYFMHILPIVETGLRNKLFTSKINGKPLEYKLSQDALEKVNAVWHRNTFVGIFRDRKNPNKIIKSKFFYTMRDLLKEPRHEMPTEIEEKPSLKNMKPKRPPMTNPLWREIGEKVLWVYAWEGYSLEDISLIGGFNHDFSKFERKPKFRSLEQMKSRKYRTAFVSKNYFDITMELLFEKWTPPRNILYLQMKQLVINSISSKKGDDEEEFQFKETTEQE